MSITDENPVTGRQGPWQKLSFYDFGATTFFASQFDQRFSYCLFVPEDYDEDGTETHELIVIVHGTGRTAAQYRDYFANFARAPLHRAGTAVPCRHRRAGRSCQLQTHRVPRHSL